MQLLVRALVGVSLCVPLVVAAACSSTPEPVPAPTKDAGGGGGMDTGAPDTSPPPVVDSGADAGTDGPVSHAFGADCTGPSDCDSMVCFIGGSRSFCSLHCDAAAAGADCPMPPTTGACNMKGYCK